jgi:hypothetical protein
MNKEVGPYHIVDFPPERLAALQFIRQQWCKHSMYGLLEVDVTDARRFIEGHKARTGERLSFTGYLVFCLAHAVAEDKAVQAYMKGRKQLILFDDVNVGLMIEHKVGEKRVLMGHVVRGANHKTYLEVHQDIRAAQAGPVPPGRGMASWVRRAMLLPWPVLSLFNAVVQMVKRRNPAIFPATAGTVAITAVGMFGQGQGGWGIAPTAHALTLVVGGIAWKPAVVQDRIEPREILHLTVVFNHDVIDGAPVARFTRRLVELIERGYGLREEQTL